MTPQSFNFRTRINDPWSAHTINEIIDPVTITFSFDCTTSALQASTALTSTKRSYTVKANGSSSAQTDTTTVTFATAGCEGRNTLLSSVEIFHNGEFRTFKEDGAADPNSLASTYAWLTATLSSSNPKKKVDLSFNTANAALFPDNLKKPVTYYVRTKTWDSKTWTTAASNPFYQTVEITFTHECYNA